MRTTRDRIGDIQSAIESAQKFARYLDATSPVEAQMALHAIERNLAVIGEAVGHLPDTLTTSYPEIDWKAIRGIRIVLTHVYFDVDSTIVRDVVDSQLTELANVLTHWLVSNNKDEGQPRKR